MIYVFITFFVLLILNIYCARASHNLFKQSKNTTMIEKCHLAADEVSKLNVLNTATVTEAMEDIDNLKMTRVLITDPAGLVLYDSMNLDTGRFAILPEIVRAIDGMDVFTFLYHDGAIQAHAASPIDYYGTTIGSVYMMEYDTVQGALIKSLLETIFRISLVLEIAILLFSLIYSGTFSRRMKRIMTSMRIIQQGDYTHKVQMGGNDELSLLGDEFNDLTERLHTSEQKRRRFVSDASHELKTPLASIKLLSDSILQNDMDVDTIREFVNDIGNEADRLNRMTAKLLSLTKVDGEVAADCEIIYMTPTITRVHRMLSAIAAQADIQVELDLEADTPVLILEDDLYQIVFNLMENGIKYNTPGGKLSVRLSREEDNAILSVADTGMGIPEDALPHIFERFYRVDKARSRATGGSGLGLAIVRVIVERNKGEISVSSESGKGSTFRVSFPAFDTEVDKA
mgnify:CR=1 FL=1